MLRVPSSTARCPTAELRTVISEKQESPVVSHVVRGVSAEGLNRMPPGGRSRGACST